MSRAAETLIQKALERARKNRISGGVATLNPLSDADTQKVKPLTIEGPAANKSFATKPDMGRITAEKTRSINRAKAAGQTIAQTSTTTVARRVTPIAPDRTRELARLWRDYHKEEVSKQASKDLAKRVPGKTVHVPGQSGADLRVKLRAQKLAPMSARPASSSAAEYLSKKTSSVPKSSLGQKVVEKAKNIKVPMRPFKAAKQALMAQHATGVARLEKTAATKGALGKLVMKATRLPIARAAGVIGKRIPVISLAADAYTISKAGIEGVKAYSAAKEHKDLTQRVRERIAQGYVPGYKRKK